MEWDLQEILHLDLLDFFRGVHSWHRLYRLLRKLPQESRYKSEIHMNMPLAERVYQLAQGAQEQERMRKLLAAADGEEPLDGDEDSELEPTPSVGHSLEVELLMKIFDILQVLNSTLIGVNLPKGKKAPRVRPLPRPRSALQVIQAKAEARDVKDALAQIGIET